MYKVVYLSTFLKFVFFDNFIDNFFLFFLEFFVYFWNFLAYLLMSKYSSKKEFCENLKRDIAMK